MKKCRIKGNSAFISSCHPRGFLSGISSLLKRQSGGDSQLQHLGMTPLFNNSAFTLIELLVVVLIIGILAVVALPQYQQAVVRSRLANAKHLARAIVDAQRVYYLANGQYATSLDQLDITVKQDGASNDEGTCWFNSTYVFCYIGGSNYIQQGYSLTRPQRSYCVAKTTDLNSLYNKVCQKETGDANPNCDETGNWCTWKYPYKL